MQVGQIKGANQISLRSTNSLAIYLERKDRAVDQLQTLIIILPHHLPISLSTLHSKQSCPSIQAPHHSPQFPSPPLPPPLLDRSKRNPAAQRHPLHEDEDGEPEVRLADADEQIEDAGAPPADGGGEEADAGERDAEHGDGGEEEDVAEDEVEGEDGEAGGEEEAGDGHGGCGGVLGVGGLRWDGGGGVFGEFC